MVSGTYSRIDILENKKSFSKSKVDLVTKNSIVEVKSGLDNKRRLSKTTQKTKSKVLEIGPLENVFPCSESKVLDFLVAFQDYDYSISDIAEHSGIGFKTTLGVVKHLEDQNVIVNTRNVGRALMFKLNLDSKQAKSISTLALHIATRRVKENQK